MERRWRNEKAIGHIGYYTIIEVKMLEVKVGIKTLPTTSKGSQL